ncbi:hypothetical protein ACOMHN_014112 [Nucella lapillus]
MMGVPTELREDTDPPDDALKASEMDSPAKEDNTSSAFIEDGVIGTPSEDGTSLDHKGKVLDENANEDFKVEKLQLNELTGEDGAQDSAKPAADGKDNVTSLSDQHDVTAGDMAAPMTNGSDLLTPQDGEQSERGEQEEEGGEEEEEEPPEMTAEERKEMHEAVKAGDIDLLEDLLDKPNADINMVYFGDNLLVTALRSDQLEMAEFLLDNGVDPNFAAAIVHMGSQGSSGKSSQKKGNGLEVYRYPCRQMAYDKGYLDIVEIIDVLNGRLFPGLKPSQRFPRYRRPPPTPTRSSTPFTATTDTSSSSSSSGDESDISGVSRSSVGGGGEDVGEREPDTSWAMPGEKEGGLLSVPTKRTKKTKKKKKTNEEEVGGGEEPQSEKDSGVPESRKTKSRRKGEERVVEKDGASSRAGDEDGASGSSRRSGLSRGGEGNLTDRSKATTRSSSERTKEEEVGGGEMGVNDEGYETMSPCPSHPSYARGQQQQQQQGSRFQPPSILVKPNKAFLALRRTTDTHRQHCIPAKYNEARPLQWRKVRSSGSYQAESPLWHRQPSALSPKLPPPTPAGTPTTVCMLSPRSGVQSRSSTSASLVSTVELSAGNVTKPKILNPSSRVASGKSSVTAPSTVSSAGTFSSSSSLPSTIPPSSPDRLYPLQMKVPSYMRMTTSCYVKRRLEPSFTSSYTSLDFVEPTPFSLLRRPSGESAARTGRVSGEDSAGLSRKSASPALSGRSGSLPLVLDVGPSASPSLSRKKGYGVGGLNRGGETVPNIRNNSSVLQTSKLTSVSAKVR